jgi:hypothetical protein
MFVSQKFIFAGLVTGLMLGALTSASAETTHDRAHRKVVQPPGQSLAAPPRPYDELQTSTSVSIGSQSRYMADSISSGSASSMGQDGRGGNRSPLPDSSVLKFGF